MPGWDDLILAKQILPNSWVLSGKRQYLQPSWVGKGYGPPPTSLQVTMEGSVRPKSHTDFISKPAWNSHAVCSLKLKAVPALCSFKWPGGTWPKMFPLDKCQRTWLTIWFLHPELGGNAEGGGVVQPKEELRRGDPEGWHSWPVICDTLMMYFLLLILIEIL